MPDGTFIAFDEEWNRCFDIYFSDTYTKKMTLQDMLHYSLQSMDINMRKTITNSIILTGGGTSIQNFNKRLGEEYETMLGQRTKPITGDKIELKFKDVHEKIIGSWSGGSLLTRTSIAEKLQISKQVWKSINEIGI